MADKIAVVYKKIFWEIEMTKEKIEAYKFDEEVDSPSTKILIGDNVTKWFLRFYPGGDNEEYKDSIALYLLLEDADSRSLQTSFTLGIVGKKGNKEYHDENPGESFDSGFGWSDFLKRADFLNPDLGYLVDGKATLFCELTICAEEDPEGTEADSLNQDQIHKFKKMFGDELFADFEIETSEKNNTKKILKAHKNVLAFGSSYFYGMLTTDMKETKDNVVKVPEDSVIMNEVLRFIYTGDEPENLSEIANELVFAAEKYQLDVLKQMCFDSMAQSLSTANVLQALTAADHLTASETLKAECIQMIVRNFKALCNTEDWKKLTPGLFTEIMHRMYDENRDTIYL